MKQEWQILEKVATASVTEQRKARRWGIFFKLLTFFYLFVIIASLLPKESSLGPMYDEHVALVSLDGVIAADAPANANTVVAGLRDAFADDSSKAVILSINSPGGSPVQSGYINDEIYRLRALYPEKKLYAVIADLGASGGYYVASAADEIYADKASLVGSIGVISAGFGFEKLIEKMGVERRIYSAGESKAFLDSFSAEKERDVTFWQSVLAETHAQFIEVVKTGRGERLINDPAIFSGLIWTGEGALAKGLIDGLGSAGYVAREVIGVEDVIDYTVEPNPFEQFAKRIGTYFALGVRSMMAPQLR
ncbi:MAG: S49 family peptidase [Cellvibrionales bacterium]|nr:S49 family peptidase [Cellvibrionales bacterium]|tara:strand:+ start:1319 stop:2239 length:921 start_codon:yes stop_codon:yes gene_type:complete